MNHSHVALKASADPSFLCWKKEKEVHLVEICKSLIAFNSSTHPCCRFPEEDNTLGRSSCCYANMLGDYNNIILKKKNGEKISPRISNILQMLPRKDPVIACS